ncbi:unnamed protein product, partial [marine sediment metagenome]
GTDVRVKYSDGRMVLGRQYHFKKVQVRGLLKSMAGKGMIEFGNRGFRLLPLNDEGEDS